MVRLEVWDTGVGIAADRQEEIFEEFHRIETAEESGFHGVGLGLSIVRRTADLLNHKVSVCSSIGHGSMFSITVPSHQSTERSDTGHQTQGRVAAGRGRAARTAASRVRAPGDRG